MSLISPHLFFLTNNYIFLFFLFSICNHLLLCFLNLISIILYLLYLYFPTFILSCMSFLSISLWNYEKIIISHPGPCSFSPQWMIISWPPKLLCFTRQVRPTASPAATFRVTRRYHVRSTLGKSSPLWVPSCSCSPRIHITHTGFGWKPETWHTSSRRPGPGLEPLDTQASGFTRKKMRRNGI